VTPEDGTAVGILANPAAGRDIRRLVAQASVFPMAEKCSMILRLLSALGACGVGRVYMMPDVAGIAARIRRALETPEGARHLWPRVIFLEMPMEDGPADTLLAAEQMVGAGVGAIIVLGGDGTHRLVARVSGDVPLTALSTGTNNVFPRLCEATTAGLATALVATGKVMAEKVTRRNKVLRLAINGTERDLALVDVCVSTRLWTGSRALWGVEGLDQLFVTFAEADAIGLSAVAGLLRPVSRQAGQGLRLDLAPPEKAPLTVTVPIAPGLIVPVGVAAVQDILPGQSQPVRVRRGVIALDGEREIEFADTDITIWLDEKGPRTIQIERVMACAAQMGLLAHVRSRQDSGQETTSRRVVYATQ
jgi:predicted polyphosphate/ATP-dependent NAD kinase